VTHNEGRPLAGLGDAIDRTLAGLRTDAKPPTQIVYRNNHGQMVHRKIHGDGTVTDTLVGHHG
jgi:hypothetical protein